MRLRDARAGLARLVALAALAGLAAALLACSGDGGSRKTTRDDEEEEEKEEHRERDDEKKEYPPARPVAFWLAAEWVPVKGELRGTLSAPGAVPFEAEIPRGILENTEFMLGKNWMATLGTDPLSDRAGPDFELAQQGRAFATPEAFAAYVEDPKRRDMKVLATERLPDDRFRFVYLTSEGSHLEVAVWMPIGAERGVWCLAHYWGGLDERARHRKVEPVEEVTKWLDRFCKGVELGEPAPPK